eukprot:GILI01063026.1.p1 GENE.GILI01063026.1~~GILI01063026.1.p1  ORF type:complete len:127 (+),score=8.44 GILI01063026.1:1-381(+)
MIWARFWPRFWYCLGGPDFLCVLFRRAFSTASFLSSAVFDHCAMSDRSTYGPFSFVRTGTQNAGQNLAQIICFKCTQPGHKANVCTNPPVRNNQHHQYGQQQQRYIQGGDPPPGFRDVPASGTLMQ